jgi:hypothetical protein
MYKKKVKKVDHEQNQVNLSKQSPKFNPACPPMCVIDNFIGMYGEELKITREYFIDMCQEYYKEIYFNWNTEYGISPRCVNSKI